MTLAVTDLQRLSSLLDQALDLSAPERTRWLAGLPDEARPLAGTLRELLARHAEATGDFARAPLRLLAEASGHGAGAAAGSQVGPYRLIRELGTGGMGAVWLAERADGLLDRKVALKLPHASWTCGLAQRFARERAILSALEHPHIARLYDAGEDSLGRPYMALEYVEGEAIDSYCRMHALDVPARLGLLLQVAGAVAFAHGRLVLHRDLKPGNILVTATGQVRLLDFGIAKLIEGDAARETWLTRLGGRALTLDYASPEQIRGEPLGTSSDIYSLGVIAFELLAGMRPYRLERRSAAALEEAITSIEPQLCSDAAPDRVRARHLRGDLDAVINKALKKRPADRYGSVAAFAGDLQAWLDERPVQARPDSWAYRSARFLRRHRVATLIAATVAVGFALAVGIGATTLVVVALAGGFAAALWQAAEARRGRAAAETATALAREATARAEAAAEDARREATRAGAIGEFMVGVFRTNTTDQPDPEAAARLTAPELLERGVAQADALRDEHRQAHAQLLLTFGMLFNDLGRYEQAARLMERALEAAVAVFGPAHAETQKARLALVWMWRDSAHDERVRSLLDEALAALRAAGAHDALLLRALSLEADIYWVRDPARAVAAGTDAGELMNRLPPSGTDLEARAMVALGRANMQIGQYAHATAALRRALALYETRLGSEHPSCAQAWSDLADVATVRMDVETAEHGWQRAIELMARHSRVPETDRAIAYLGRFWIRYYSGALAEARDDLRIARQLREAVPNVEGLEMHRLIIDVRESQLAVACGDVDAAVRIVGLALPQVPPVQRVPRMVLQTMEAKARLLRGEHNLADAALGPALDIAEVDGGARLSRTECLVLGAQRAAGRGDATQAERRLDQAAAVFAGIEDLPRARFMIDGGRAEVAAAFGDTAAVREIGRRWIERLLPPASDLPRLAQAEFALLLVECGIEIPVRRELVDTTLDWLRREQVAPSPLLARAAALVERTG